MDCVGRNVWRTNQRVPQECNHRPVKRAGHTNAKQQTESVWKNDFPFVYWEGTKRVMKYFPEMFGVWVTKHVSYFQGTNHQLLRISRSVQNVCLSCGCHDDASSSWVFAESVEQLVQWLVYQQSNSEIKYLFKRYLLAHRTHTLTSLLKPGSKLGVELWFHDRLGWDCFLGGRLCTLWVEHRARHIKRANLTCSANFWAQGLVRRLLQMTHAQWVYWNATVYLEVNEGCTAMAHEKIHPSEFGLGCWCYDKSHDHDCRASVERTV